MGGCASRRGLTPRRRLANVPLPSAGVGCVRRMLSEEQDGDRGSSRSGRARHHGRPQHAAGDAMLGLSRHGEQPDGPGPSPTPRRYQQRHHCRGVHLKHRLCAETRAREGTPGAGVSGGAGPEPCRLGPSQGALLQPKAGSGESEGRGARRASTGASWLPQQGGALLRSPVWLQRAPRGQGSGNPLWFFFFFPFELQEGLKGWGGVGLVVHLWRGLLGAGGLGMEVTGSGGSAPGSAAGTQAAAAGRVRAGSTFHDETPGLGGTKWVPW